MKYKEKQQSEDDDGGGKNLRGVREVRSSSPGLFWKLSSH